MGRRTLSDHQWNRIKELIRGKQTDRGVTGCDNRLFVDAVLWIARTGAPWRNLPPELGHWNNTWRLFARWVRVGVWESLFKALPMILTSNTSSSTPPSCARTSTRRAQKGGSGSGDQASRGGLSTKLHISVDALGNPLRVRLTPGHRHEMTEAKALIEGLPAEIVIAEIVIADSTFDAGAFRDHLAGRSIAAVIAANLTHVSRPALDRVEARTRRPDAGAKTFPRALWCGLE